MSRFQHWSSCICNFLAIWCSGNRCAAESPLTSCFQLFGYPPVPNNLLGFTRDFDFDSLIYFVPHSLIQHQNTSPSTNLRTFFLLLKFTGMAETKHPTNWIVILAELHLIDDAQTVKLNGFCFGDFMATYSISGLMQNASRNYLKHTLRPMPFASKEDQETYSQMVPKYIPLHFSGHLLWLEVTVLPCHSETRSMRTSIWGPMALTLLCISQRTCGSCTTCYLSCNYGELPPSSATPKRQTMAAQWPNMTPSSCVCVRFTSSVICVHRHMRECTVCVNT